MKIEIGRVDTQKDIWRIIAKVPVQRAADAQQLWQPLERLHEAHDRKALHGVHTGQTLGFHQRAAHAFYCQVGKSLTQRRQYPGAENVTGGLTSQNAYPQAPGPHLADDAALRGAQGVDEDLKFGCVGQHGIEPLQGDIKGQALSIHNLEGTAQLADRIG